MFSFCCGPKQAASCKIEFRVEWRSCLCLLVTLWVTVYSQLCLGQDSAQNGKVRVTAVAGEPFGVLIAEIPIPRQQSESQFKDSIPRVIVSEASDRTFYPVVSVMSSEVTVEASELPRRIGRPGGLLDRVRKAVRGSPERISIPSTLRVCALFRGGQDLSLRLSGDINKSLRVQVEESSAEFDSMLFEWWTDYQGQVKTDLESKDFPALVHQYLISMLSRRLELPRTPLREPESDKEPSEQLKTLELLAAIEPLRETVLEEVLTVPVKNPRANLPVPSEPAWQAVAEIPLAAGVPIEELASRVPPECFYLRFGSFTNYVWFHDLAERYGGDMAQAVLLRGFNYESSARMERMLAAKMTQIAKMFGDKLIGDMAVIGSDLYMKEGASLGVVFFAKQPDLLAAAIESDRKSIARENPDAAIEKLQIAGKEVLLIRTPDNRIRSFYVADGAYVCVTTSETIVRRFIEVGRGAPSLAETNHFKAARSWMPDGNNYNVFAYFSPQFFYRLVSPQYQIELRRRLEAIAHIEVAELASQAAAAEGVDPENLVAMREHGLLPPWFNQRADGAETIRAQGEWIDSLRGGRGSFLPIADVVVSSVSETEAQRYAQTADFYQNEWRQMDPMIVGLRRFQSEDGSDREKIAFEGYIAPFQAKKYGWLTNKLAPAGAVEIQQPPDDAATLQVHMRGDQGLGSSAGDYVLFAGVKDMTPPHPEEVEGIVKTLRALHAAPAYIGAWPKPGIVEQLPLGLGRSLAQPDLAGYSRMLLGLWRWQSDQFSLLSFDRSILDSAIPYLEAKAANDTAQARLAVAPLQGSQLAAWINDVWYERGWRSSHGNARLMDVMHQQLKIPDSNCLESAERLLDVRLQCPLGGDFEFQKVPEGTGGWWQSSAWQYAEIVDGKPTAPDQYAAPWIDWFRGGKVHLTQGENSLAVIGEVDLELKPLSISFDDETTSMLPKLNFDVFRLPGQIFGGASPSAKPVTPTRQKF
jgi:hypothetical protein